MILPLTSELAVGGCSSYRLESKAKTYLGYFSAVTEQLAA